MIGPDGYGDATIKKHDDGRLEVLEADDVIGISVEVLAKADESGLYVDDHGRIWLAGHPGYCYAVVRLAHGPMSRVPQVLVCERVP